MIRIELYIIERQQKWNEETCHKAAKECTSRENFKKNYSGAYHVALKNGWINDYDWFNEKPKNNYWNEETCRAAAKECTTRKLFSDKYSAAYDMARKNGWLDSYDWFKEKHIWNEETCRKAAKECTSRGEFLKKNNTAYTVARKNGWLDELFPPKHLKECLISDIKPLSAYLQYQRI